MAVVTRELERATKGFADVHDLTAEVAEAVRAAGLRAGTATVFVPGSTAGVTTLEFEPGLLRDLPAALEHLAPQGADYRHDRTWHDGNGFSHVRAALLGPSLTVPFSGGELLLGTWQQIVLVDCDNRPRARRVLVQIMGE